MLHSQCSKGTFMGNVKLFKFSLEAGKLSFPLLVELNLSGSVGTCLLKT